PTPRLQARRVGCYPCFLKHFPQEIRLKPTATQRMSPDQKKQITSSIGYGLAGLCLLAVMFIAPFGGDQPGESLFQVARDSTWRKLGDWSAAWASLQIILLSCGVLLLL